VRTNQGSTFLPRDNLTAFKPSNLLESALRPLRKESRHIHSNTPPSSTRNSAEAIESTAATSWPAIRLISSLCHVRLLQGAPWLCIPSSIDVSIHSLECTLVDAFSFASLTCSYYHLPACTSIIHTAAALDSEIVSRILSAFRLLARFPSDNFIERSLCIKKNAAIRT
jgi:hypothetical protein